jgi:hypothetical protein
VETILGEGKLRRNLMQTREGGHDICGLDHLAIEVKRCETLEIENGGSKRYAKRNRQED